jgi:hypothetical protein
MLTSDGKSGGFRGDPGDSWRSSRDRAHAAGASSVLGRSTSRKIRPSHWRSHTVRSRDRTPRRPTRRRHRIWKTTEPRKLRHELAGAADFPELRERGLVGFGRRVSMSSVSIWRAGGGEERLCGRGHFAVTSSLDPAVLVGNSGLPVALKHEDHAGFRDLATASTSLPSRLTVTRLGGAESRGPRDASRPENARRAGRWQR